MKDFFVSFNSADRAWADWIAWTLEEAGYQVVYQPWDARIGGNFVLDMQKAASETRKTVIVLTDNYLQADYTQPEWAAAFVQDPRGEHRKLIPLRVAPCTPTGLLKPLIYADLVGLAADAAKAAVLNAVSDARPKPAQPPTFPGVELHPASPVPAYPGFHLDVGRLPIPGPHFVGRQVEIARLDIAWEDPVTHVLTLVAFGGVGKSALVARWMDRMAADGWRGAARVLDWSFYSQGSEDRVTSAEPFIDYALRFFGDPDPKAGSLHDRGARLASLIRKERSLLVLDGIEPLQYPPGRPEIEGRLKDPGLAALLKGLAAGNSGLCVVTTREHIADLAGSPITAPQVSLEELELDAAVALLRQLGVDGLEDEMRAAAEEFQRHALTLTLLGNFLRRAHRGDVRKRREIDLHRADEKQGGHAFRVIGAYARWLGEGPELAILRLLGLFDRPAEAASLKALRATPPIPGLTEPLVDLSDEDWRLTVATLREHSLLAAADPRETETLDAHPLVRACFAKELESQRPDAWQEGNRRLYEHLRQAAPDLPDTLEAMQLLYTAVVHGCRAGRQQEAMDEVYWPRITRSGEHFNWHRLGAFGLELMTLKEFFDQPWHEPSLRLSAKWQGFVLNEAGFCMRAIGRLAEAVQPMKAGLDKAISLERWGDAASGACNLSELTLISGEIGKALSYGAQSVSLADRIIGFLPIYSRANLANALHQAGQWEHSEEMFLEAEKMQAKLLSGYPLLCSTAGYQYCDLLLSRGEPDDGSTLDVLTEAAKNAEHFREACRVVAIRAKKSFQYKNEYWYSLLDLGLDHLILGRSLLGLLYLTKSGETTISQMAGADLSRAAEHLDRAVAALRLSRNDAYLPLGLLARAVIHRLRGNFDKASADLVEILDLAERGPMRLHQCDAHLEWARLCRGQGDLATARQHVVRARELVNETGYRRREREVRWLEGTLTRG